MKNKEMSHGTYCFLFNVAREKRFTSGFFYPRHPEVKPALDAELVDHTKMGIVDIFTLTEKGKEVLKRKIVSTVQISFPNQPPLILSEEWRLIQGEQTEIIVNALSYWMNDNLKTEDGIELFCASVKTIDLYTLATLPEWEPI